MQSVEAINEYFNQNFNQLKKYAARIISDKKRDYDAGDVLSELYLRLHEKRQVIEKIDHFSKRFISTEIVFLRSNMNLNQSLKSTDFDFPEAKTEEKEVSLREVKQILTKRERAFVLLWETEGSAAKAIEKCNIGKVKGYQLVKQIRKKSNQLKHK